MRLAGIERDFFELASGEEAHSRNPKTFWIPERSVRESLRRGQAAKLIFEIEGEEEDGSVVVQGERMWVIVSELVGSLYVGVLDNEPCIQAAEDVYLRKGAEVPFGPEHVIDIGDPPEEYWQRRLAAAPTRTWPRE
jgi:hypothetical protein